MRRFFVCGAGLALAGLLGLGLPAAAAPAAPEAQVLASRLGSTVTLLRSDEAAVRAIMRRALDFGKVTAVTGNGGGDAVLERTGVAMRLEGDAGAAMPGDERQRNLAGGYVGGDIDLRFHFADWKHAFAVVQPGPDGSESRSLQFFDENGAAIHKLYLRNESAGGVFDKLAADFRAPDQSANLQLKPVPPRPPEKPDASVNVGALQRAWYDVTDAQQFNQLLFEAGIQREQALRLAPPGMVHTLAPHALRLLLEGAAARLVPIMAVVGNGALTQVYSGPVANAGASAGWFGVQDPNLKLLLRESALGNAYVVLRAGVISVECFDKDGELLVSFFGVREGPRPQPQAWTELTRALPRAGG